MPFFGIVPLFQPIPYIKMFYEAEDVDPMFMNGLFQDLSRYGHILIPDEIDPACATVVRDEDTGELKVMLDDAKAETKRKEAWVALRAERDRLLAATDRYMLPDYPSPEGYRDAILAYRQALRELPQNTENPLSPVWPTRP